MIRASQSDLPAITDFLRQLCERAMFPLSNLARFGLDGEGDYAPSMWFATRDGAVSDVLTVGRGGGVMPVLPNGDWEAAAEVLRGRRIAAVIGPTDEVRPLIDAIGLQDAPVMLDRDEPHFVLDLNDLVIPEGPGELAPLAAADPADMIAWRAAYEIEALGLPADKAGASGARAYRTYIEADSHRVLIDAGRTLSTSGFNARIPEMVQVGGVYTPPERRGRGHARRVVALHLDEARRAGVRKAVLFSASQSASRAYRAIGFQQIGEWTLFLTSGQAVARG